MLQLQIEDNLLMKILALSLEKMSPEERQQLAREMGIGNTTNLNAQALLAIFQSIFKAGGFKSYQLTLIIANAVVKAITGSGLKFASNRALTKTMSILTEPIGWAITSAWTIFDIAGSAYRIIIPAVIEIAYLRKLAENREEIKKSQQ